MDRRLLVAILLALLLAGVVAAGVVMQRRGTVTSTGCEPDPARPHFVLTLQGDANADGVRFDVTFVNPTDAPVPLPVGRKTTFYWSGAGERLVPLVEGHTESHGDGPSVPPGGRAEALDVGFTPSAMRRGASVEGVYFVAVFAGEACGEGRARVV